MKAGSWSWRWLHWRGLLATAVGFALSGGCLEERSQPRVAGTLSLDRERGVGDRPSGALRVAFSSPQGPVGIVTEVSVVFDRPVHPLGGVSEESPPFRIAPERPGSFRWVGSRAAVFTPHERLPFATAFSVEVPAGLRALDGTELAQVHRFELETRRPALERSQPSDGEEGLPLDTPLRLELNQVVSPAALRAAATLQANQGEPIPFDVTPDAKDPRALLVKARRPLPPHSDVTLTLAASLRGAEGPLTARKPTRVKFRTYEPLVLEAVECARSRPQISCEPGAAVALRFNNSVKLPELASRLHISPDPGLKRLDASSPNERFTSWVDLPGSFRAGQTYRVQIDAGLTDAFGQTSPQAISTTFAIADDYPRVEIGAVGRNFAGRSLSVPIAVRNVPAFDLLSAALSPQDLLAWRGAEREGGAGALEWLASRPGTRVQPIRSRAAKNQIERLSVDTQTVLGASGRGALAIGARYSPAREDWQAPPQFKLLNVSDLGITAKLSRFGSLVWITERRTNQPVSGATLELFVPGKAAHSYTSDADGLLRIPSADFAPDLERDTPERSAILVARRGDDSAFAPVSELIEGYRLDVPTDFSGELRPYGVLFSDRGIYRPGDDVQLKGIVRIETPTGNALPPEQAVTVALSGPGGEEVSRESATLSAYGTLSARLHVPAGAGLGAYYATVSGLGRAEAFLQQTLQVSEYRPVELRVSAASDHPAYFHGETAIFEVKADYLFGAAAAGLSASVSVSRERSWFAVPGAVGFTTDAQIYYQDLPEISGPGELRRETRQLDGQGRLGWSERLDLPGQRGTELVRLDAEVTDVSRRSVASSMSALVHPASFYVGLSSDAYFIEAPGKVAPRTLVFEPGGKRLSGQRVSLELVERRYTSARERSGDDFHWLSKPVDRSLSRCELTSGSEPASCSLEVPAAGYYLVLARAKDQLGREAQAALPLYAAGGGEPTWASSDRRSVELVLDKKSYAVGEQARVLVKSPYKVADALITVERAGLYRAFRRVLRGTAPSFVIPVTSELAPNAFVGVHLLPERTGQAAPLEPGSFRVGYANLQVDAEARRLSLGVTPNKSDYRPGDNIDVKLSVKDARGAPQPNAELTLDAADEGVLSLIDYRTPDPLLTFSAARPLQVATLESRDAEGRIALGALSGADKGRDGGGGGDAELRRDFRQTAYFNPRIVTDERGEARVSFKLPDSLTTYRLMAVGVTKNDRYGFSEARVTTSKPLMARPALPRFVRAGDSFDASVIVSKKGLSGGKVRVSARLSGLEAMSPLTREVELAKEGSLELRFAARAVHPGQASVRFEVDGNGEHDVVTTGFPIAAPMTPEAVAVYGQTDAAELEQLGDLSALRDDTGQLTVSLSSTALVGIEQTALDLIEYPYSCTEQLSSKLLPLLALGELGRALGFTLPQDAQKQGKAALGEVLGRQQSDGGFSMWPESARSGGFISGYATLALLRAARAGSAVPRSALERARDFLRGVAQQSGGNSWDLSEVALALDVLGELGYPDAGGVNRLYARRAELPLFAKALLLHAALGAKLESDVPKELTRQLEAGLHIDADRTLVEDDGARRDSVPFDSPVRTQALVLRALSARGKQALLAGLARGLLGQRQAGKYRTTQESAWALLALDDYRRVAEPEPPRFEASFSLAGRQLGKAGFGAGLPLSERYELPVAELLKQSSASLRFEKQGSGQLFYEARLRYVRRELPRQPLEAGFYVEKSLRAVSPEQLGTSAPPGVAGRVSAGDLVLVDLTLVTPAERRYVVLEDPLPAGLEAVDPKLLTTADWLRKTGIDEPADPDAMADDEASSYAQTSQRSEVRDDRALFFVEDLPAGLGHYRYLARATTRGRFVLPPTRVSEMYTPEVFGRTGGAELSVE
jgi:uncharacterized protein YfaS (alpha-2-macroglobulin family)